jgi:hypothetical protein
MKHRHVFRTDTIEQARKAVVAARRSGVRDEDISLIARSDIELESIPPARLDVTTDTVPAGLRGALGGGVTGLLAGVAALAIPPLGVTVAGIAALTALGAAAGTWSAALMGSAIPNPVRRAFEAEIEQGRILLVIDCDKDSMPTVETAVAATGAVLLPFDMLSTLA